MYFKVDDLSWPISDVSNTANFDIITINTIFVFSVMCICILEYLLKNSGSAGKPGKDGRDGAKGMLSCQSRCPSSVFKLVDSFFGCLP